MKRVSTRFWLCASAATASLIVVLNTHSAPQTGRQAAPKRTNELTLAKLRPGMDSLRRAQRVYRRLEPQPNDKGAFVLHNMCYRNDLFLETDSAGGIKTIRLADDRSNAMVDCYEKGSTRPPLLATGLGLTTFDSVSKVIALYGEPDSRSPSTKNGQPLELLYYAFDWAGPDVPQVMEVVCTAEKEGKPGQVVEITLAAGSL